MWITLSFQYLLLSVVECGSHSLEFLSTGSVQPGDGPQFEQLTVFDGVPISHCKGSTKREELKPVLESADLPEYCVEARSDIIEAIHEIPPSINCTVYCLLQRRRGCTRSPNGTISSFDVWAVNGTDFINFDPELMRWTSWSPSALQVQHLWNKKVARKNALNHFIREQCPLILQSINLRSTHHKTEVRVFAKPDVSTDRALLTCHVTTTDKSVSSVQLIGNGASQARWGSVTGPLPSEDGSVIFRLRAGISLNQNTNIYGCAVQTGGHNFTVFWDGTTLDGRHLLYASSVYWKNLALILGLGCIIGAITLLWCAITFLLRCVTRFDRSSRGDLEMTRMHRAEDWNQWMMQITSEEQDFYDPEYFGRHFVVLLPPGPR
ncbi:major histocompatibility complex class I-related gene protein-like isoform X2 [Acanthopagrus latus]|uniref:major histocompatibility complex class I-related gene protein-like isoform X2 n=1 Tax=Acanthopagrus latus TaxID=8177 RepID=UPI00187C0FF5|nr:major histocompatibility complex class I-related gene protein-like isoform X2 [Acanthopagrus latus]